MIKVIGPKDKKKIERLTINTTSSAKGWSRGLSPFYLGPCELYGRFRSLNMENGWQYSKVYKDYVDADGEPSALYFNWAMSGWKTKTAVRYPMGRGAKSEYSLWDGKKLGYIEARKEIYIPLYSKAVRKTEAWKTLESYYKRTGDVSLWDYDGYDYLELGMTLDEVVECEDKKMGHAFVLAMMLEDKI